MVDNKYTLYKISVAQYLKPNNNNDNNTKDESMWIEKKDSKKK